MSFGWRNLVVVCWAAASPLLIGQGIPAVTRRVLMSPAPVGLVNPGPASAVAPSAPSAVNRPAVPMVVIYTKASPEEVQSKLLEFQKKKAAAGAAYAQYELGMRYLKGDGVRKDVGQGKTWLQAAAKQGDKKAARELERLTSAGQ